MACSPEESVQIKAWLDGGFTDHRFWEINKPLKLTMRGDADIQELLVCLKMFFSIKCECILVLFANSTMYELQDETKTLSNIRDAYKIGNYWILRLVAKKDYSQSAMKDLALAMEKERKTMEEESIKEMNDIEKGPTESERFGKYFEDYEDSDDSNNPDDNLKSDVNNAS